MRNILPWIAAIVAGGAVATPLVLRGGRSSSPDAVAPSSIALAPPDDGPPPPPEEVHFPSGPNALRGFLFAARSAGRHPAIVYNHGSEQDPDLQYLGEVGEYFQAHGFVVLFPLAAGLLRLRGDILGEARAPRWRRGRPRRARAPQHRGAGAGSVGRSRRRRLREVPSDGGRVEGVGGRIVVRRAALAHGGGSRRRRQERHRLLRGGVDVRRQHAGWPGEAR